MATGSTDIVCVSTGTLTEMQTRHDALSAIGIESRVVGEYLTAGLGTTMPGTVELWVHRADVGSAETALRGEQRPAVPEFADIRVVGLDDERSTRADPALSLFDVHFQLSALPPIGWSRFVRGALEAHGVAGRQGWAHSRFFVVRCAIDEVEAVLNALRPLFVQVNQAYREWAAREAHARADEAAFDQRFGDQLRDLKSQLKFD